MSRGRARLRTTRAAPALLRVAVLCLLLGAPAGAATKPQIHLTVHPALAEASALTSFHFVATRRVNGASRPVRGATIRFAGARAHTDRRGRATIVRRLDAGHYRARACKTSFTCGSARVTALPHG